MRPYSFIAAQQNRQRLYMSPNDSEDADAAVVDVGDDEDDRNDDDDD